ncbi:hypothetical protein [Gayadomonas joobiniege]|uniref:hypothetical protein n=1 Tax=Gayadomonas joobiniege TaxID=1234606 RepID=UPI00036E6DE0|nr:hypothetical protein [Gayadomonas joobiniege]
MEVINNHLIKFNSEHYLLVDCPAQWQTSNIHPINPNQISWVFLSHASLATLAGLPKLIQQGYRGSIICSPATAALLPSFISVLLESEFKNADDIHQTLLERINLQLRVEDFKRWFILPALTKWQLKIHPAGFMLGSAFLELMHDELKHFITPVLGSGRNQLLPPPRAPFQSESLQLNCNILPNTNPTISQRKKQLHQILKDLIDKGKSLMVIAPLYGATLEILYAIEDTMAKLTRNRINSWTMPQKFNLYIDADFYKPKGLEKNDLKKLWGQESRVMRASRRHPLDFDSFEPVALTSLTAADVKTSEQFKRQWILLNDAHPMDKKRISQYFSIAKNATNVQLLVTDEGIFKQLKQLCHSNQDASLSLEYLAGYSGHADISELTSFVKGMRYKPAAITLAQDKAGHRTLLKNALKEQMPELKISELNEHKTLFI